MPAKLTENEIHARVLSKGYKWVSGQYTTSASRLTVIDTNNYKYDTTLKNLLDPRTDMFFVGIHNSNSIENIKLWLQLNNKPFTLLSNTFISSSDKLEWQCLNENCKEIFFKSWSNTYNGFECPYCAGKLVGKHKSLGYNFPNLVAEWHPTKNGTLTPYDFVYGSEKKVWWLCKHGHEWQTRIVTRSKIGCGCPYCDGKLPTSTNNLAIHYPHLVKEWDYERNNGVPENYTKATQKKVHWICSKCNHRWQSTINNRTSNNRGCPRCNFSKGENKIEQFLVDNIIVFKQQCTFEECRNELPLRFDFYLPDYNICIEYQGRQHYKAVDLFGGEEQFQLQQKLDNIKRDYCLTNNIKLIEIPYWDFKNIDQILQEELKEVITLHSN